MDRTCHCKRQYHKLYPYFIQNQPIVVGQKYTYTVKGYNSKYNTNGHYNARGLTVQTKPSTVQLSRATLASNKQSVTVSWNRASGCNYYCVFRKTPSTGWKRLANLRSPQTSYIDRNPSKDKEIFTRYAVITAPPECTAIIIPAEFQ